MKVLLVCAGGMSTSVLMRKLEKYATDNAKDFEVAAVGVDAAKDAAAKGYDCVLLGPQIGYRLDEVKKLTGLPCAVIAPADYGIGNCVNIFKQIDGLIGA